MSNEHGDIDALLNRMEQLVGDDDAAVPECEGELRSSELQRRLLQVARRTGLIGELRCCIEETEWRSFRLHGFHSGRWNLSRVTRASTEEFNLDVGSPDYVLEPAGTGPGGLNVHRIAGLDTASQADQFFSSKWRATRADASVSHAVDGTRNAD